jgi:SAM-dependent methyltransferase
MITYVTPTHNTKYLKDLEYTVKEQVSKDWRWLIVPNGDVKIDDCPKGENIRVIPYPESSRNIGAIKKFAFSQVDTSVAAELDHDDLLTPNATKELCDAFSDPSVGFAYSDCAEFWDESFIPFTYNKKYGWTYREEEYYGKRFKVANAWDPTPQALRYIYWAPNHIRAWRKDVYDKIGGHNSDLLASDDHDLICRTYMNTKMHHIPRCLYLYRMYKGQSFRKFNKEIQVLTHNVYDIYITLLVEKWCDDNRLQKVDLCGGTNPKKGYFALDRLPEGGCVDLEGSWPLPDDSVGLLRAVDAVEHLKDPVFTMSEAYRVLAPGGFMMIEVPSTDGRGAFQDPTHKSKWNSNSFWYYTKDKYAKYIPEFKGSFQKSRLINYFPSRFHETHNILYTRAHLIAVKEGIRIPGLIEIGGDNGRLSE